VLPNIPLHLIQRGNNRQVCFVAPGALMKALGQRYIELNPVRAGMVAHPAEYRWPNYRANAQGSRMWLTRSAMQAMAILRWAMRVLVRSLRWRSA